MTFNDHEGSTKSYPYTRKHNVEVVQADFVPPRREITADYDAGTVSTVTMHDGSTVRLRKVAEDYDPTDRDAPYAYIRDAAEGGEVVTGLLFIAPDSSDMHDRTTPSRRRSRRSPTRSSARAAPRWTSCSGGSDSFRFQLPAASFQMELVAGSRKLEASYFSSFSTTSILLFSRAA